MKPVATVDEYIINNEEWKAELIMLRAQLLSTELSETIKWGGPVYTINKKNVVGLGAFKKHVAVWFFQGSLLLDKRKVLINAQEKKTNALRHLRFKKGQQINLELVSEYVAEAIENQKAGLEIKPQRNKPVIIPEELNQAFESVENLKTSFEYFTKAKQREFANHVASAKREETRHKRVEKIIPLILNKVALNDKYR